MNKLEVEAICKKGLWLKSSYSDQFSNLPERRAFYKETHQYFASKGYEVKWMNVAEQTVELLEISLGAGAEILNIFSDYGSNKEIRLFVKEGNKAILDDVICKIKNLEELGVLKGEDAKRWDAQTLSDEQELIQPYYESLTKKSLSMLQNNIKLKYKEKWKGELINSADRWRFGMLLMGYNVEANEMPPANLKLKKNSKKTIKEKALSPLLVLTYEVMIGLVIIFYWNNIVNFLLTIYISPKGLILSEQGYKISLFLIYTLLLVFTIVRLFSNRVKVNRIVIVGFILLPTFWICYLLSKHILN